MCHARAQHPPAGGAAASAQAKAAPVHGHARTAAAGAKRAIGAAFERRAQRYLEHAGLVLVARNVTVRGGEIDLVMREQDGTLVFVEVRARTSSRYGGAAASIGPRKRQRIAFAAHMFWAKSGGACACRFDVVGFDSGRLVWLRDAFRIDDA
ncbi:YraN family protein [Burkholderia sp. TSV86]|uniref:YraN family protein n=1 Tax=Burkholderia sp. TSV86 TaxID=1385594 RepID=UPI00268C228D